jgi:folate-dependent phosphoribosylglycinamide formyltransferase PurN
MNSPVYDMLVPYYPISSERKKELETILREGNVLLDSYHKKMKELNNLSRHDRTKFLNSIFKQSKSSQNDTLVVNGVAIDQNDLKKILEIKNLEWEILCGFSRLITKIAIKKSKQEFDLSLSLDDLIGEAYHATLHAISHYTKSDTKFITFLHHCVRRHLSRVCNKTNGLSDFSAGAVKLRAKYNKLASEEGANFDSVVSKMHISEREIATLPALLCKVQNMTTLEKGDCDLVIIDNSFDETQNKEEKPNNMMRIVSDLELTELERAVLEGFVKSSSSKLGLNSVSKTLINPKTNKPYSRMAFTFAWRRIKEKIAKVYGKVA